MSSKKKTCLTGIKPTGMPHLGNYLGAIKPAIEMANSGEYELSGAWNDFARGVHQS